MRVTEEEHALLYAAAKRGHLYVTHLCRLILARAMGVDPVESPAVEQKSFRPSREVA